MRHIENLSVTIKHATSHADKDRVQLSMRGDDTGEIWLVPAIYEAECDDDSLPYRVHFWVEINAETSLAEIARIDIYARPDGEAVHARGIRDLPLAAILQASVREAATFFTWDDRLDGYVKTTPTKRPKPRAVSGATDRRTRSPKRKNAPKASDADSIMQTVESLRRRGVRDWVKQACNAHGVSRSTLYRRLENAEKPKPNPQTTKRGKR
jgi:predicted DNA-binding protein (UPF0251 family)